MEIFLVLDPNGDTLTYVIFNSRHGGLLEIKENVLKLKDDVILDYDQYSNLNFFIRVEDTTGLTFTKEFNVSVIDDLSDNINLNQTPTSLDIDDISVYENLVGEELGLITAYDPDGDDLFFELSGFNSHHFDLIPYEGPAITLDGWQGVTLKLKDNWSYDYENLINYGDRALTIKVSDPEGLFVEENFEYQILDDSSDNPVVIDTTPPVLNSFEIVDTTLSIDEQIL